MGERPSVLFLPPASGPGAFRSLERVAELTRTTLLAVAQVHGLSPAALRDPELFRREVEALAPLIDVVFDSSALVRTGPLLPRIPVLLWALGNLPRGAGLLSGRRSALKTTDALLVNCRADREIFERTLGQTGPRAPIVPFAVDTDRFHPPDPAERERRRRELGLPAEAIVLIYAGRLNVQKNVHGLLDLFARARHADPRLRLILAGEEDATDFKAFGVRNAGYRERLAAQALRLGLGEALRFTGRLPDTDLVGMLGAADLFVSLSLHHDENFGFAPVEAMAAGLPALVTDWGGYRDAVEHAVSGIRIPVLLARRGVRAAGWRALRPLLALAADPALRTRMGQAARARCESLFSLPRFRERLDEVLREAASRRGQPARHGSEAFRFHPLACKLQARNAMAHLQHERAGIPPDPVLGDDELDVYRFFIEPYATADVAALEAREQDRPSWLGKPSLEGHRLELPDPIWPVHLDAAPGALRDLLAADGRTALRDLARESSPAELLAVAGELAREGALDLGRPFPFEEGCGQTVA